MTSRGRASELLTDDSTRARMSRQAVRDTRAEREIRRELHRAGFRFRLHRRPVPNLRRQADIVFGPARVAVFVDGCFWHGCPDHKTLPRRNADWWAAKIVRNRLRDLDTDQQLQAAGWMTVRVWEHEDPAAAARRVGDAVRRRLGDAES